MAVRDVIVKPVVGLVIRMAVLGSEGPEFEQCFLLNKQPGGVDLARHPFEVGEMSTSVAGEGHSISRIVVPQQNDSFLVAKLPYVRIRRSIFGGGVADAVPPVAVQ